MNRRHFRSLLALNMVLVGVLALVSVAPSSDAQSRTRSRGDYAMLSGRVIGSSEQALWIVDSGNQELMVMRWDRGKHSVKSVGYRDLATDLGRVETKAPMNPAR